MEVDRYSTVSLVLGSYVNGYSIIRELYNSNLGDIALFSYGKSLGWYSNKVSHKSIIDKTSESLKKNLFELKKKYDYIVIFPTDDLQLENLHLIYDCIEDFCYVPFNNNTIIKSADKFYQYECCEKFHIPYPKTRDIKTQEALIKVGEEMMFPLLFKPNKREDITSSVFRSLYIEDIKAFNQNKNIISNYINEGVSFLASEYIPGDDTNIFAYVGYRNKKGIILNEWIGKKLTQFPDKFGVFSSASNEAPLIVKEQGRILLNKMDLFGIAEPEFKYDPRDGKFKLMEINLRSMMWHRLGSLCGVDLHVTQYNDALNLKVFSQKQIMNTEEKIHLIYFKHEILNLIFRRGYWKHFYYNLFGGVTNHWVTFDKGDIKPFLYDASIGTLKQFVKRCLEVLNIK